MEQADRAFAPASSGASLLELAANNDLVSFKHAVEVEGALVDEPGNWYSRQNGAGSMACEGRTPAMIAATYGSLDVLSYILSFFRGLRADVNRQCGADSSTALHCAVAGGSSRAAEAVALLLRCGADSEIVDTFGRRPLDLVSYAVKLPHLRAALLKLLRNPSFEVPAPVPSAFSSPSPRDGTPSPSMFSATARPLELRGRTGGADFAHDASLPDVKSSTYTTDEFRMYRFKIQPCSRAYSHDWTECPFAHPGENARRRDPRRYHYSCVPCPDFRKGACRRGDSCEYAHGVFECWLHPAQYRTRLCKDGYACSRSVCFFAHSQEELRPVTPALGMAAFPSPRGDMRSISPPLPPPSPQSVLVPGPFSPSLSSPPLSPPTVSSSWIGRSQGQVPALMLPSPLLQGSRSRSFSEADRLATGFAGLGVGKPPLGTLNPQFRKPYPLQIPQQEEQQAQNNWTLTAPRKVPEAGSTPVGLVSRSLSYSGTSPTLFGWGSPTGKPDWGVKAEETVSLRQKLAAAKQAEEITPDISWVHSLVGLEQESVC